MSTVYTQHIDMHSDFVISQSDSRPMYLQIMEQIRQRVAVGEWKPGDEIPSIRQLAVMLRVSVITVKRAYLELEREGVILTQHGKGSVIAPEPNLNPRLYEQEFEEHIESAAQLALRLGIAEAEAVTRLREAMRVSVSNEIDSMQLTEESV